MKILHEFWLMELHPIFNPVFYYPTFNLKFIGNMVDVYFMSLRVGEMVRTPDFRHK